MYLSMGRGVCCQADNLNLTPRTQEIEGKKSTNMNCSLTSIHMDTLIN